MIIHTKSASILIAHSHNFFSPPSFSPLSDFLAAPSPPPCRGTRVDLVATQNAGEDTEATAGRTLEYLQRGGYTAQDLAKHAIIHTPADVCWFLPVREPWSALVRASMVQECVLVSSIFESLKRIVCWSKVNVTLSPGFIRRQVQKRHIRCYPDIAQCSTCG